MALVVNDYKNNTFFIDILGHDKETVLESHELKALSYMEWNEIGLQVVADEAPPIKNLKGDELIPDIKEQRRLEGEAEMFRNVMRLVVALEGGEGIEWGDDAPTTLQKKAEVLLNIDSSLVLSLVNGLRTRAYGKAIRAEESEVRFQRLQAKLTERNKQSKDND